MKSIRKKKDKPKLTNKQLIKRFLIGLSILLVIILFCNYQNNHLVVTNYTYKNAKISEELDGFKIVFLSDLHNEKFGSHNKKLIKKIDNENPDIVVITGDIVDSNITKIEVAVELAEKLTKKYPVYYVTGNHEYWLSDSEREELLNGLRTAGVEVLLDENRTVKYKNSSFELIGLDDESLIGGKIKELSAACDEKSLKVVLAHEPEYFERYSNADVDLILCGHEHGGQFILPVMGPLISPGQGFFPEFAMGEHKNNDTTMIISRGLGNSIIPVRLFNYPEIVCIELKK